MSWTKKTKTTSDREKPAGFSKSTVKLSTIGRKKAKLSVPEQEEGSVVSSKQTFSPTINQPDQKLSKGKSATVESPLLRKKKIWRDKLDFSKENTLTTKLSKILDRVSTLKEKGLTPFWTQESKELSKKLWLPTKIGSVDSILTSSKELSKDSPMGESWFSIERCLPLKKNLSKISSPLSQYSLLGSTASGAIPSKENYKTLVIRIFPTTEERTRLKLQFEQFRWYWYAALRISDSHFDNIHSKEQKNIYNSSFRDIIRKYEFVSTEVGNVCFQEFIYHEDRNSFPVPEWWDKPNDRVICGAIQKFTSSLNAAISNYKAGNCKNFKMKSLSKKSPQEILHFEDLNFPAYIKNIRSRYWFTTKDRRRVNIPYSQIPAKGGVEVVHEKETGRYFLHVPVERSWFPEEDRRNDNQAAYFHSENRIIALDPGVRKFLVGYDPEGKCYIIGGKAQKKLISLLKTVDKLESASTAHLLWKRIKNLISELHWKVASFLTKNYDIIMLPDFRVSQMVKKGKPLGKMTKRLLNMFSFYKFKEKLQYKCDTYGKKLLIVDESYTSCTCGVCGEINKMGGAEVYLCQSCGLEIDRDVIASRNILIKNSTLR